MKDLRYIAYYRGENNGYEDSDFYIMLIDTVEEKVIKHVYGTTRHGGGSDFEHSYEDKIGHTQICQLAEQYATKMILSNIDRQDISEGDIVTVTNPRARKHKGVTFKVDDINSWKSRYGRVESETLLGLDEEGNQVKTSLTNCSAVVWSDSKLKLKSDRLAHGCIDSNYR